MERRGTHQHFHHREGPVGHAQRKRTRAPRPHRLQCRAPRYEYEDPDYSISGLNLQEQDLQALRFATLTLLQFRDMPVFQQYQNAIGRIFDRVHAAAPGQGIDQHIQFEQAPQTLGTEHIAALMSAIGEHRVVRFTYRKFIAGDQAESERCIEPYLLKEYRNRWYLIGKPEGDSTVKTFALDRMSDLMLDAARFERDPMFDADRYFKDTIGITSGSGGVQEFQFAAAPCCRTTSTASRFTLPNGTWTPRHFTRMDLLRHRRPSDL